MKQVRCIETGQVFASGQDAANWLGVSQQGISSVLRRKQNTCGGYHWEYVEEGDKEKARNRQVKNLDSGRVFASIAEAARYYDLDRAGIQNCVTGRSSYCGGFRWAYADGEPISGVTRPRSRPTMTIQEVLEEARRRTEQTGRKVTYADIQVEETIRAIKAQEAAEKKRRAKRCKTKSA